MVAIANVVVLCVVYGKLFNESVTLHSLRRLQQGMDGLHLVIWNNGPCPIDCSEDELAELKDRFSSVEVINSPKNESLSRLYNLVISHWVGSCRALCLLDDDTEVPQDYFFVVVHSINECRADLYLPLVYQGACLVSPAKRDGVRIGKPQNGLVPAASIRAIASGMVVPAETAKRFSFDERFSFYGADTDFVLQLGEKKCLVLLMDVRLEHSISTDLSPHVAFSDFKFNSLLQSFLLVGLKHGQKIKSLRKICRLALRQAVLKKSAWPLFFGISSALKLLAGVLRR